MKTLYIHPDNPQPRLMSEVVSALKSGKLVIIPTENGYRFGFGIDAKEAFERLKRLGVTQNELVLICQNISQLSYVATITDDTFASLKSNFLPHHLFILTPTKAVNKKIITKNSLAFGSSATPIVSTLLGQLEEPIFIAPLYYQGEAISQYHDIADKLDTQADIFVDVGVVDDLSLTVIDLTK